MSLVTSRAEPLGFCKEELEELNLRALRRKDDRSMSQYIQVLKDLLRGVGGKILSNLIGIRVVYQYITEVHSNPALKSVGFYALDCFICVLVNNI